jgi:hypothetical protein
MFSEVTNAGFLLGLHLQRLSQVFHPSAAVFEKASPSSEPGGVVLPEVDATARSVGLVDFFLTEGI